LHVEADERGEQAMRSGVGLMDGLAALDGTSVALAITGGDGGGSDEGNDRGDESNFGEHFGIRTVSVLKSVGVGCLGEKTCKIIESWGPANLYIALWSRSTLEGQEAQGGETNNFFSVT
jgi:hypothetical protein